MMDANQETQTLLTAKVQLSLMFISFVNFNCLTYVIFNLMYNRIVKLLPSGSNGKRCLLFKLWMFYYTEIVHTYFLDRKMWQYCP